MGRRAGRRGPPVSTPGPWRPLAVFFLANVLFGAGLFYHALLYNFYLDALGLGETVMGWAQAALTAGGLLALLPAGRLVDRVGSRTAFFGACALAAAGLALGAVATAPGPIYVAALVAGLGTASWRVAMGPIVMQLSHAKVRSRAFSWNVALLVASGAVWMGSAGATAAWLERAFGLSTLGGLRGALLAGAAGTALAALAFAVIRCPADRTSPTPRTDTAAAALGSRDGRDVDRRFLVVIGVVALWMIAPALVLPFFNIYFQRAHMLAVDRIGVVFGLTHAATALIIVGSGELAARLGPRRLLAAWTLLFGPMLWALAGAEAMGLAVTLYFLQGIVSPATNPLIDQILLERAPRERRGAVSSWRNGATEVGGIVGAAVGGTVLQRLGFDALFVAAGVLGAAAALLLIGALRRLR